MISVNSGSLVFFSSYDPLVSTYASSMGKVYAVLNILLPDITEKSKPTVKQGPNEIKAGNLVLYAAYLRTSKCDNS